MPALIPGNKTRSCSCEGQKSRKINVEQRSFPVPGPGGKRPALVHCVVSLIPSMERRRVNSHTINQEPGSPAAWCRRLGYESEKHCLSSAWRDLAPQEAGFVVIVG